MKKIPAPTFALVLALCAGAACGANDFFGLPDKIVVPKSVAATPAPATPAPATPMPVVISTPKPPPNIFPNPLDPPVRPEVIPDTPPPPGTLQVFACAKDQYTLYLNGREILTGADSYTVQSGNFPIVKGDVLAAIVQDTSSSRAWLSLRVVRDGTTIFDAGDMLYQTSEPPTWKTSKLMSGFREPSVKTHYKRMGTDSRPRAASAAPKDATATTLYFKGVVP